MSCRSHGYICWEIPQPLRELVLLESQGRSPTRRLEPIVCNAHGTRTLPTDAAEDANVVSPITSNVSGDGLEPPSLGQQP